MQFTFILDLNDRFPFHISQLVKYPPFSRPEAWKRYLFKLLLKVPLGDYSLHGICHISGPEEQMPLIVFAPCQSTDSQWSPCHIHCYILNWHICNMHCKNSKEILLLKCFHFFPVASHCTPMLSIGHFGVVQGTRMSLKSCIDKLTLTPKKSQWLLFWPSLMLLHVSWTGPKLRTETHLKIHTKGIPKNQNNELLISFLVLWEL